jgi:hypothetical protein
MIYGPSYDAPARECENCGHHTSEYSYCAACDVNICDGCDHVCECRDCGFELDDKGVCLACADAAAEEARWEARAARYEEVSGRNCY